MGKNEKVLFKKIEQKIYTIRGIQIMLDRDLAVFYQTETRTLKQAVKRNSDRFPMDFMFELNGDDIDFLVSQSVIPSKKYLGGAKPFAFTEQGVSMLSAVIRTPVSVEISLKIMRAFVDMRKFISYNAALFQRIEHIEVKQFATDNKINMILDAIGDRQIQPRQGIFFDGQIFDAYKFVADLIRSAKKSIILIDNYIDDSVLTLFSKKKKLVNIKILTKNISKNLELDVKKFNSQYPTVTIKLFDKSHDRFLIIDEKFVYHFGASLKDLGKKWFAFSKMDISVLDILKEVGEV